MVALLYSSKNRKEKTFSFQVVYKCTKHRVGIIIIIINQKSMCNNIIMHCSEKPNKKGKLYYRESFFFFSFCLPLEAYQTEKKFIFTHSHNSQ